MSLNGLDSLDVQEAHQAAVAEAGGWILLKYVTRDSVELLGRGKGGVTEARNAIAAYTESSPLYGLIIYRRRKVLIKYLPEGTSRVLLARTAVHFQDVLEKYSPYETLLEIKTAEGLNDTSLAASFPLHTATPSASSHRLHEINEDEDEGDGVPSVRTPAGETRSKGSYFDRQRQRRDRRIEKSPPPAIRVSNESSDKSNHAPSLATAAKKPHVSSFIVRDDAGQQSISSLITPNSTPTTQDLQVDDSRDGQYTAGSETPRAAMTPTSPLFKPLPSVPSEEPAPPKIPERSTERMSRTVESRLPKDLPEQPSEERPTTSATIASTMTSASERYKYDDDPYDLSKFDIKPKQKLGPRPVTSGEKTKRPTVASISSVPATYRPTSKRPDPRPQSQIPPSSVRTSTAMPKGVPAPPPIPEAPEYNPRPLSRGSIKSLPSHKSTAMTPDKIRLMKAVELRKKQLRKSNPNVSGFVPPPDDEVPALPGAPEHPPKEHPPKHVAEIEKVEKPTILPETSALQDDQAASNKADSGIEMGYDKPATRDEEKPAGVIHSTEPVEEKQLPAEPAPVAAKPLEPQSPKVDTPRDATAPSFEESEREIAPEKEPSKAEDLMEEPTPQEPVMAEPEPEPEVVQPEPEPEPEPDEGPALPMSRHALPVDDLSTRSQSIDDSRPSQDDSTDIPTIVMEDGSRPLSAIIREARSEDSSPAESDSEEKSTYESPAASTEELVPPEKSIHRKTSDLARRRRGFVEPLQIDDDSEVTDDDEFMDELQSAEVQEAKPITVARSPVAHYFPRRPSYNSAISDLDVNSVRTVTVGDRASTTPVEYRPGSNGRSLRSMSPEPVAKPSPPATYSPTHSRSVSTVEKVEPMASYTQRSVSSGISKRIQALAEKSSREGSLNGTASSSRPTSPETSVMDQRQQTRSPPLLGSRTSSFRAISRHSARISSYQSLMGGSVPQQPDGNMTWNMENDNYGGVGSVSVTARIIRPTAPATASEYDDPKTDVDAEFQPSHLVVSSHKRGTESQSSIRQPQPIDTSPKQEEDTARGSMSPTMVRPSVDAPRQLHSASKFGRHKPSSPTAEDFPAPPPSSKVSSPVQAAPPLVEENGAPKESTRTSRFFKRMSNIGNKRRSTVAQSNASSGSPASERGSMIAPTSFPTSKDKPELPPALTVGDLNIQFPDSLLWKRRIVEIDEAGYISFSISQAMEHQRGATKKYQLSEFRMPYIPDLDRQELPNSIMLDFIDGTTLQIACEDGMTHRQVTHVLKSYWKAWAAAP